MARPPKFNRKEQEAICLDLFAWMATGKTILEYFEQPDRKIVRSTFNEWILKKVYPEISDQYAHAQDLQRDVWADQIITISDNGENDTYKNKDGDDETNWDNIQRSKLRVDSRKWLLSKLCRVKYGDSKEETPSEAQQDTTITYVRGPDRKSKGGP